MSDCLPMAESAHAGVMSTGLVERTFMGSFLRRLHAEDGAAAVPFVLALPLFLMIVSIVVQFALLVAGDTIVQSAADAAGRSAMVVLPQPEVTPPDDANGLNTDRIKRAAYMVLASASPQAATIDSDGVKMSQAFSDAGMSVSSTYAARYSYAMHETTVTWSPQDFDFTHRAGTTVTVSVSYPFQLTVPFAANILATSLSTHSGVSGRFSTRTRTVTVYTTPARMTGANSVGYPTGP